jgi:hypothetical protein
MVLETGRIVAGTINEEDATSLTLVIPRNKTVRIARDTIDEQSTTTSAMTKPSPFVKSAIWWSICLR